jgi:hypothetical protein
MAKTYKKYKRRYSRRKRSKQRGGSKEFHFYNGFHYGDNILNLKFLRNISQNLKDKGITIKYYYDPNYIRAPDELQRYVDPAVVTLKPLNEKPAGAVHLWMGDSKFIKGKSYTIFNEYYKLFYEKILSILGLDPATINTSLFQKEEYLQDIYNKLDPKFHNLDILVINAVPNSGQLLYNKGKIDSACVRLAAKYKIATTSPVNDSISCTFKDGLKLQDIGAISTHVKYIIAVNSGPIVACFNTDTQKSVKKWIVFDKTPTTNTEIDMVVLNSLDEIDSVEKYLI